MFDAAMSRLVLTAVHATASHLKIAPFLGRLFSSQLYNALFVVACYVCLFFANGPASISVPEFTSDS